MNDFVSLENCIKLKELGFNERCPAFYNARKELSRYMNPDKDWNSVSKQTLRNSAIQLPNTCTAPSYAEAFRWFREEHKLVHSINFGKDKNGVWYDYDIFSLVLPTDTLLGDEEDEAVDVTLEGYESFIDHTRMDYDSCSTYEQAEELVLTKLIEIVFKRKRILTNNG